MTSGPSLGHCDVFGCHVNLFVSTFGDRAKNGRKTGVGWAIGSNNLTSWSQLTPSLCWVGAIFVLLTALATRNGQRRLQKRTAQQNRASPMAFEDIAEETRRKSLRYHHDYTMRVIRGFFAWYCVVAD